MCMSSRNASTIEVKASDLRAESREHEDNYSEVKLRDVCGSVRYL
jgi:hypothetical protein